MLEEEFQVLFINKKGPLVFSKYICSAFFKNEGTSLIDGKKHFDLALLARSKGIHQFLLKVVNCLQFSVYLHGGKKRKLPNSILKP